MQPKKDRVVVDTNLWISFLLSNDFPKLNRLFNSDALILLFSEELLHEFVEVATRPKFKKYFSTEDLNALLSQIELKSELVKVSSKADVCRDKKDNFLLALAVDGKATHLISGDKDLLVIEQYKDIKILSITEYLK